MVYRALYLRRVEVFAHATDAVTEGTSDVDGPHSEVVRVERPFSRAKLRAYGRDGRRDWRGWEGVGWG